MNQEEFERKVKDGFKKGFVMKVETKNKTYFITDYIAYVRFVDLYYIKGESINDIEYLGHVDYSDIIKVSKFKRQKMFQCFNGQIKGDE